MNRLSSHIVIRVVVLVLVGLSVMGYTTVLNYCTMSHSSECCCHIEQSETAKSPASGTAIERLNASCNIKIIAGGLNPVAQNVVSESATKSISLDLVAIDAGTHTLPVIPRTPLRAHANDIAPPSVDIYIRTATLLI